MLTTVAPFTIKLSNDAGNGDKVLRRPFLREVAHVPRPNQESAPASRIPRQRTKQGWRRWLALVNH